MKIVNIEAFPIRVKNDFDIGRKADTKNINTAIAKPAIKYTTLFVASLVVP